MRKRSAPVKAGCNRCSTCRPNILDNRVEEGVKGSEREVCLPHTLLEKGSLSPFPLSETSSFPAIHCWVGGHGSMVRRRPIDEGALREYWSTSPMMLCLSFKEGRRPETEGKLSSFFPSIHPSTFVRSPLLSCPLGPSFLASGGGPNYHSGTRSHRREKEREREPTRAKSGKD